MKARLLTTTVTFAVALTGCAPGVDMSAIAATATAKVGEAAPAFSLVDSTGQTRSLADFAGKTVVLEWTNHDCPFVKKHYGADNMQSQQRDVTGDAAVWLTVNSSAPGQQGHVDGAAAERIRADAKAAQTAYLLDPDGTTGRAYGAVTTPHMYIIDPDGMLRYAGAIDSIPSPNPADIATATQYVPQALAELAAGKPVSAPLTRPYGCAVKYAN
jgi:peroxiredoxin